MPFRPKHASRQCRTGATIRNALEAQARQGLGSFFADRVQVARLEIQRSENRRRHLSGRDMLPNLLLTQPRVGDEQRDVSIVERAAAVLGGLLAAAVVDEAPIRLSDY